ncbi:hypothetical protein J9303_00365 [Bacillaceae bacterium Marseille-Q3522]|nr:hypothetical protein [Bacillaceae bacterium Marseille-Q3522]
MLEYKTFMRHAGKVTKTASKVRPFLKGVKHYKNGSAVVTDGFRLYLAKHIHNREEEELVTPKGEIINIAYPDVRRVFPSSEPQQQLKIDLNELLKGVDMLYTVGRLVENKVVICFRDNYVSYKSKEVTGYQTLPVTFSLTLFFDALYWEEALKLFKAADSKTISVNLYGTTNPAVLKNGDESLIALIMPVRREY